MAARIARVCGAVALVLVALAGRVEAKSHVGFVITGGELGDKAVAVHLPLPDEVYVPIGLPVSDLRKTSAPEAIPEFSYDIYDGPYRAWQGPQYRYYRDDGMFYDVQLDAWYTILPRGSTLLAGPIDEALGKKARGETEDTVLAAFIVGDHLSVAGIWLRPTTREGFATEHFATIGCGTCAYIADAGHFALSEFAETLSHAPHDTDFMAVQSDAFYFIEFFWAYEEGGVGGLLGLYAPPSRGQPGRFWAGSHAPAGQFFETSSGFDATVERALASAPERTAASSSAEGTGSGLTPISTSLGFAFVVFATSILFAASTFSRRTA